MQQAKEEYGLNKVLEATELPKSTWYYHQNEMVDFEEKYLYLKEPLLGIVKEHKSYGYRREKAELEEKGYYVSKEVIRKLNKLWGIPLMRKLTAPKPSEARKFLEEREGDLNLLKGLSLEEVAPLSLFYTDFTELKYRNGKKKVYFMPLVDHVTKWAPGWAVSKSSNRDLALEAFAMMKETLTRVGVELEDTIIHHDQDSVYTSYDWLFTLLVKEDMRVSFSENGAKGNTSMESFFGRFKTENNDLLLEVNNIWELRRVVTERMNYYNAKRRHSALNYQAPLTYIHREEILSEEALELVKISG